MSIFYIKTMGYTSKLVLRSITTIILLQYSCKPIYASDIIEVLPLTDQIIMIHLDDGYVRYHGKGQLRTDEIAVTEPLDIYLAGMEENYTIFSQDHSYYEDGVNPEKVGRKSKGTEFTWLCEFWGDGGCYNESPDHAREHWIYLKIPEPMISGRSYLLNTGSIAKNGQRWAFTFDEKKLRSEAVHVNLLGYLPQATKKFGYVYHWMGELGGLPLLLYNNNEFHIIDIGTGTIAHTGNIKFRKDATNIETFQAHDTPNQNFLGGEVFECDFSTFSEPGEYVLSVEGIGCSFPFRIADDVYRQAYYDVTRALFHNRSGISLDSVHTNYPRPAPHNPNVTPGFSNRLMYTSSRFIDWENEEYTEADLDDITNNFKGNINTWGWYQDAGDWDGYFSHMAIPSILMFTWEIKPENFLDGELDIPGSGNGIPDILDEAAWLVRYFYRTRHEIIDRDYGTGGIGARVSGDRFGGDGEGTPSYEDVNRTWIVSGEDPFTTYKYAGMAAHLAYCLNLLGVTDPEGVDWEQEAREAFQWAAANTRPGDENPKPAIEYPLGEIRMFAAANLYRLTGESAYHDIFKSDAAFITATTILEAEQRWGPFIYALLPDQLITDQDLFDIIRDAIVYTADYLLVEYIDMRAARWGGNIYFPMLVGQGSTPMIFEGMIAYSISSETAPDKAKIYLENIQTTCDYFLGTNPLNMTWVTQLGERNPNRVFHMDAWYNGQNEMHPGIIPYGPWRDQDFGAQTGPWSVSWTYKTIYPLDIKNWPGHERWFTNYTCPLNAEFTVHQNTVYAAVAYGFLAGTADGSFEPNEKPSVSITSPSNGGSISENPLQIRVNVSDPNGNETIRKVEFYNSWHKIGESKRAPFDFTWEYVSEGDLKLVAKAYDSEGLSGISDTVNITSTVVTGSIDEELNINASIRIFPNPNRGSLFIEIPDEIRNIQFMLIDINGKLVYETHELKNPLGENLYLIKLPKLNKGIYAYVLKSLNLYEDQYKTGKILID